MHKIKILSILLLMTTCTLAQLPPNWDSGLDKKMEEILATWHASGFAVAVVHKDQIIYSRGFGYRDYENKKPVTPNTLFAIGSSTKAFTSGLLGILREEAKLAFDDKPAKYVPELSFHNDDMNNQITIKDIMTHRTGLPRHDLSWYFFNSGSRDSLIQRIKYQEPFAKVRETWHYNNFMFLVQGVIAERITGKSWEENIQEKFFNVLEMKTSNSTIHELKNSQAASYGYELKSDSIIQKMEYYNISGMGPAGSINSSVNEMSNWLIAWINGGKFKDEKVLPAAYVREAMSPQMIVSNTLPDNEFPDIHLGNYGYGWIVSSYKGHYRVEHGGNINGFSANVAFYPTDSIGIVVLANQNGSSIPGIVRNEISDRVLNVQKTDWNTIQKEKVDKAKKQAEEAQKASQSNQKKNTKPSHLLVEFTGDYSHPGYGSVEVKLIHDSLFAVTPYETIWLQHYHYNVFSLVGMNNGKVDTASVWPFKFNFKINDMGEISSFSFQAESTLEPLEFKRTPKAVDLEGEILEKYAGEYELLGITSKFYLKPEVENILFLFVPGQPEYELLAIDTNKFAIKIAEGFTIEFKADEAGNITEAVFIQPNGTFIAKKK